MRPVNQLELHDPPDSIGDCFRACIASILELPADEVPHFGRLAWPDENMDVIAASWLALLLNRELVYWDAPLFRGDPLWDLPLIASGKSPRSEAHHAVVWQYGKVAHDPHPSDSGLDGEPHYFITIDKVRH